MRHGIRWIAELHNCFTLLSLSVHYPVPLRGLQMRNTKIGSLAALVLFLIWLASGFFIYYTFPEQESGPIGDMFGSINALIAGLTLAGVAYTALLQREDIFLQRGDVRPTRQLIRTNVKLHASAGFPPSSITVNTDDQTTAYADCLAIRHLCVRNTPPITCTVDSVLQQCR